MELPIARVFSTVFATLFLVAVALKTLYPGNDPYRCRAVQNTGRWIDPPQDEAGNRTPFLHWQPDGCILHQYDSEDARRCLEGRPIVSVGDSTSRNVAFAFSRLVSDDENILYLALTWPRLARRKRSPIKHTCPSPTQTRAPSI